MNRFILAALVGLAFSVVLSLPCVAVGSPMDSNGDYWYGWYGASSGGVANAEAGTGTVAMVSNTTGTFGASWTGSFFSGTQVQSHTITNVIFDAAGYATLAYQSEISPPPLALSPNLFVSVDRTARTEGFGGYLGVRKAAVTTDPNAMAGNYMFIGHYFGNNSASMMRGAITVRPDFTWGGTFYDLANNLIESVSSDTWSYVSGQPQIMIHDGASTRTFNLGANQTFGRIDWQEQAGRVGTELVTRITTGRTLSEVDGTWLIQGLQTDPQAHPQDLWGTMSISNGTYTWTYDNSGAPGSTTFSGTVVIDAATTGKLTFFSGSTPIMQGYMDMSSDALVLGYVHNGLEGLQIAVRAPEPASMTLLLLGAAAMLRRRRRA